MPVEIKFTKEEEQFRESVREFLGREITPEVIAENWDAKEFNFWTASFRRAFLKKMGSEGLIGLSWPQGYGAGRDMIYEVILREEMDYHRTPTYSQTMAYVPFTIIRFGSEAQKAQFIPATRKGEIEFAVAYSEPDAGSDVGSLKTTAVSDGNDFVLNGEKAFCTGVHYADYVMVAARTDPAAAKHRGLSLFLVDLKSRGIEYEPDTTISGWVHDNMHLEDLRVPKANLIGELNRGWQALVGALDFEHASLGNAGLVMADFERLVRYCRQTKREGKALIKDPVIQRRLASLAIDVEAARLASYWIASMWNKGLLPGHASLPEIVKRETARRIDFAMVEIMGPYAPLQRGSRWAPVQGNVVRDYMDNIQFYFTAGGMDVSRNILAARGLELPVT